MQRWVGRFCEGLIEAGWLATALVVPFFIDPYSQRPFTKVGLVWAIGLVTGLGWLVAWLEGREGDGPRRRGGHEGVIEIRLTWGPLADPLIAMALLLAGALLLSTATSVAPRISLWGYYTRPQGTLTFLAYILLFLVALTHIRTRRQAERLVTVLLLASFPVALYGVLQRYGLDPLLIGEAPGRIHSTLGNPVPLGGYLVLVMPLTAAWFAEALGAWRARRWRDPMAILAVSLCGLLLLVQGLGIYFSQGRGALLGLLGGGFFFALLGGLVRGRRRWVTLLSLSAVLGGVFLLLLSFPSTPLTFLRPVPYLGRFAGSLGEQTFVSRLGFWQGIQAMVTADPVRFLVGYGPDTLYVSFPRYLSAELVRMIPGERPGQAHNLFLNLLATMGLVGLGAYSLLFATLVYIGLRRLGLVGGGRSWIPWLGTGIGGGVAGVVLAWLAGGSWRYAGLAGPLGLLVGWILYLLWVFWSKGEESLKERVKPSWLPIGLLAGLMAHFIETQLGLFTEPIGVTFWLYGALIGGWARGWVEDKVPVKEGPLVASWRKRRPGRRRRGAKRPWPSGRQAGLIAGLLVGLLLMTAVYELINILFTLDRRGQGVLSLIVLMWLVGGGLWLVERWRAERAPFSWSLYTLSSLGWVGLFFTPYWMAASSPSVDVANTGVVYYFFLLLGLGVLAGVLGRREPWPRPWVRWPLGILYPLLGLVCVFLIAQTSVRSARADVYFQIGRHFADQGQHSRAIEYYERALALRPDEDRYYLYLGFSSLGQMQAVLSPGEQAQWFERARRALERGHELNPLEPVYQADLGYLYLARGSLISDVWRRATYLEQALIYYQQAVRQSPYEQGPKVREAMWTAYVGLGDAYWALGQVGPAISAYEEAKALNPDDFTLRWNLAYIYRQAGLMDQALAEAQAALSLAPKAERKTVQALIRELESSPR